MYILVDLFVHSSGPFGGPVFVWGGGGSPASEPCKEPLAPGCGLVFQAH